jgi:hypothetical protein
VILRERAAAGEYHDKWREGWKAGRPTLENPTHQDIVHEFEEEQKAWDEHAAEAPERVFDGPRDTRVNVVRENA